MSDLAIKSREPWSRFAIKAVITVALIVGLGFGFTSRFRIGIDSQVIKCIPGITFYIVDLKSTHLERGNVYAFKSYGTQPFFTDGRLMVKYLRGVPGDDVRIDNDQSIYVNNEQQGWSLYLADRLSKPIEAFTGKKTLNTGEYWFMGLSDVSFDSRYWGTVSNEQVVGQAYPLF